MTVRRRYGRSASGRLSDTCHRAPSRLLPDRARARYGLYVPLLAVAIVYPHTLSGFWQEVLVEQIGIYVLLAIGLNVVVGFAGLLDLGYIAFYAIGAYTGAYWTGALPSIRRSRSTRSGPSRSPILAAMLAGVLLGAPDASAAGRLPGHRDARLRRDHPDRRHQPRRASPAARQGSIGIPHFSVHLLGHPLPAGVCRNAALLLPAPRVRRGRAGRVPRRSRTRGSAAPGRRSGRTRSRPRRRDQRAQVQGDGVRDRRLDLGFAGLLDGEQDQLRSTRSDFTVQLSILVLVLVIFGGMGSSAGRGRRGGLILQWLPAVPARPPALRLPAARTSTSTSARCSS